MHGTEPHETVGRDERPRTTGSGDGRGTFIPALDDGKNRSELGVRRNYRTPARTREAGKTREATRPAYSRAGSPIVPVVADATAGARRAVDDMAENDQVLRH